MAVLPMFPLGTVLFPSLVLPLHVFEERYRTLVEDCLADGAEPEFGVVLIERGSEVGGGDTRSMVGTVARILEAAKTPDGRWAIGAVGTRRIEVQEWLDDDPYPRAMVRDWPDPEGEVWIDGGDALAPGDLPARREELAAKEAACLSRLRRALALAGELGDAVPPATIELSDDPVLASYQAVAVSPLGPADRQKLLAAASAGARLTDLSALLDDVIAMLEARIALPPSPDSLGA